MWTANTNSSLIQILFMFVLFLHTSQNVDGSCPPNFVFDSTEEMCVCEEGFSWNEAFQTCFPDGGVFDNPYVDGGKR
ncbi:Hypothetical predicted protein [Mytilus galloprovincialis]|uniref:Sushi domain-containing protein n=1 Tax=Mytilus galloprovincialis TaxID=29158 RepID=A0A8B6F0Q5_MYTGA|nr:Hypothetical predicted protein [Mytilus galloprovincialis]